MRSSVGSVVNDRHIIIPQAIFNLKSALILLSKSIGDLQNNNFPTTYLYAELSTQ